MLMGSADELPPEPVTKTMFVEDMTETQLAKAVSISVLLRCGILQLLMHWFCLFECIYIILPIQALIKS